MNVHGDVLFVIQQVFVQLVLEDFIFMKENVKMFVHPKHIIHGEMVNV